jgi:hypothetical protein
MAERERVAEVTVELPAGVDMVADGEGALDISMVDEAEAEAEAEAEEEAEEPAVEEGFPEDEGAAEAALEETGLSSEAAPPVRGN